MTITDTLVKPIYVSVIDLHFDSFHQRSSLRTSALSAKSTVSVLGCEDVHFHTLYIIIKCNLARGSTGNSYWLLPGLCFSSFNSQTNGEEGCEGIKQRFCGNPGPWLGSRMNELMTNWRINQWLYYSVVNK